MRAPGGIERRTGRYGSVRERFGGVIFRPQREIMYEGSSWMDKMCRHGGEICGGDTTMGREPTLRTAPGRPDGRWGVGASSPHRPVTSLSHHSHGFHTHIESCRSRRASSRALHFKRRPVPTHPPRALPFPFVHPHISRKSPLLHSTTRLSLHPSMSALFNFRSFCEGTDFAPRPKKSDPPYSSSEGKSK